MMQRLSGRAVLLLLAGIFLCGGTVQAGAQATVYPAAAPIEQYLIADKADEIELAQSAAPASISSGAEVLVLTKEGYTTAAKGGNGFVCLVARSWAKSTDDAEFWSTKVRAPMCVNAAAAKGYLPIVMLKTKLVLAGRSKTEIARTMRAALDSYPIESNR